MRFSLAMCAAFIFTMLAPAASVASPLGDMTQSWVAFNALTSYHADIKTSRGTSSIDFIKPDKMHMTVGNGMEVIRIAGDVWINRGGSWMHVPVPMQRFSAMTGNMQGMGLTGKPSADAADVAFVGNDSVGAHYTVTQKSDKRVTDVWIGGNHLPVQVVTHDADGPSTITFSKFNEVAPIAAPQ